MMVYGLAGVKRRDQHSLSEEFICIGSLIFKITIFNLMLQCKRLLQDDAV